MPNPDSTPSTQPADEDSIEKRKKLLLVLNTASQLAPEAASMKYPFQSKLLPLLTQTGLISTHYLDFAKSADSGGLSPLSWEGAGFFKLVIEGGAMGVDGLETTANYRVKQLLINDSSKILADHLNNNSSLAKIGKGIWSGSPFFSPWGKQEFRAALQSTQFHKTMENAVTASFDGAPNPRATANSLREVFQNISDKAFFKTPEFSTDKVSEGISNSLKSEPGRLADLQKARALSNIFKPLSTIILPAASVILDINSSQENWKIYKKSNSNDAKKDALTSVFSSSISTVGSIMSAASLNPRTAHKVPRSFGRLGLGLTCVGAGASLLMEYSTASKAERKK